MKIGKTISHFGAKLMFSDSVFHGDYTLYYTTVAGTSLHRSMIYVKFDHLHRSYLGGDADQGAWQNRMTS